MIHIPVAVGLLLCDQVIVAEKTRDVTPVNCFSVRRVASFPSKPFPFIVFALLADGLGDILMEVVIQRLDDLEEIYRRGTKSQFKNPLRGTRFKAKVSDCVFPSPGDYQVLILADQELVAHRRFAVQLMEDNHG